jgi:hypothetical protein
MASPVASKASAGAQAPKFFPSLFGVAAISARNAWAVGYYQNQAGKLRTLILHWNGKSWRQVASPNPVAGGDTLSGVAATSATNAWAVGGKNGKPLILRWNGKSWRQVRSPAITGALASVVALSARNAWAVGLGGHKTSQTIIEHWNGKSWKVVRGPVRLGNLISVSATSASNVWAIGSSGTAQNSHTLAERWNGKSWKRVRIPDTPGAGGLNGVAATSTRNAWAVAGAAGHAIGTNHTVIDHWNGKSWRRVHSADPNPGGAILLGVAATSARNAWAVGTDTDFVNSFQVVIERWNGKSWKLAHSPVVDGVLTAVAAASARDAWAVGGGAQAIIEHWNGTRWTASPSPVSGALPRLLGGADKDLVNRYPAVPGHDVGDGVGDVVGP